MIDIAKVPYYQLDLQQMLKAFEIVKFCKKQNIQSAVYGFEFFNQIAKYGVQYDTIKQEPGERIYRQAFHIPGWPSKPSPKSAGNDMLDIIPFFPNISKNDVVLHIWDMTQYPRSSSVFPKYEVGLLERQFIKAHINKFGYKPVGNIKDESHMDHKHVVTDIHFGTIFDVG